MCVDQMDVEFDRVDQTGECAVNIGIEMDSCAQIVEPAVKVICH